MKERFKDKRRNYFYGILTAIGALVFWYYDDFFFPSKSNAFFVFDDDQ